MTRLLIEDDSPAFSMRQRWAALLTLLVAGLGMLYGLLMRNNALNATFPFINREVGITARYPARWLLEEGGTEADQFVMRATDARALPFKTTIQITLLPAGEGARTGDVLTRLDLDRAQRLPAYSSISRDSITLPDGKRGTQMIYGYAVLAADPFLQSQPVAVRAIDLVILRQGQVLVITYAAEAALFEDNQRYFDAFVRSLNF
jgi:hypothetical protein